MKKFITIIIVVLVCVIVLAGGIGYYFSNVILTKDNAVAYSENPEKQILVSDYQSLVKQLNAERVVLPSDFEYDLVGYVFPAKEETTRTIISVHGYTNSKADMQHYIQMFHDLGFNVVTFDHRNSGESGGNFTSYGLIESVDLKQIVDFVKERFGEESMLGIHGVSMGASTTLLYAGAIEDRADFYIADCAYSNFKEEAAYRLSQDFAFIPKLFQKPIVFLGDTVLKLRERFSIAEASPIEYIQNVKSPVLFINTKTDEYIPPYMTEQLYEKKQGPKSLYLTETGAHAEAFEVNPEEYKKAVTDFLRANF